jgi:hypothetical protein
LDEASSKPGWWEKVREVVAPPPGESKSLLAVATVKMSEIEGPVLSDSNAMNCPSNHGYSADVDGGGGDDPAAREREKIKRLMEKSKP